MRYILLLLAAAGLSGCGSEYGVYGPTPTEPETIHYEMELLEAFADAPAHRASPDAQWGDVEVLSPHPPCELEYYDVCELPFPEDPDLYLESWLYFTFDLSELEGDPEMIDEIRLVGWSHFHAGPNATEPYEEGQDWWGPMTLEMSTVDPFDELEVSWNNRPAIGEYLTTFEIDDMTDKPVMVPETEDEWMDSGVDITEALPIWQDRDIVDFVLKPVYNGLDYPYSQQLYSRETPTNIHYGEDGYEHRQTPRLVVSYESDAEITTSEEAISSSFQNMPDYEYRQSPQLIISNDPDTDLYH